MISLLIAVGCHTRKPFDAQPTVTAGTDSRKRSSLKPFDATQIVSRLASLGMQASHSSLDSLDADDDDDVKTEQPLAVLPARARRMSTAVVPIDEQPEHQVMITVADGGTAKAPPRPHGTYCHVPMFSPCVRDGGSDCDSDTDYGKKAYACDQGLACRKRVAAASSPAATFKQGAALTSPARHACGRARPSRTL